MLFMLRFFTPATVVLALDHAGLQFGSKGTCSDYGPHGCRGGAQGFEFVQVRAVARKARQGIVNITFKEGSGGDWVSLECDDGLTLVGGGCNAKKSPHRMQYNGPSGKNGWKCGGHGGEKQVFVACGTGVAVEFKETSGGDIVDVECDSGQTLVGGGCHAHTSPHIFQYNGPADGNKWTCSGHNSRKQVWAACSSSITVVVEKASGGDHHSVECAAGHHQVIGGGCDARAPPYQMQYSMPKVDNNAWACGGKGGSKNVMALCYVLPTPSPTPSPTLSPTMSCRSFTTPETCPTSRCALRNNECTDYDWFILSANTSVNGLGLQNGLAADEQGCANMCGANSDSFVFSRGSLKCWCVQAITPYTEWVTSDGLAYYRVGVNIFIGKVCRLDAADKTTNAKGTVSVVSGLSYDQCHSRCESKDGCTGIEYNTQARRCELWSEPIGYLYSRGGFECRSLIKTTPCTVANGSAVSAVYPCSCGLATCGDPSTACWALQDTCQLTPSPTPYPTPPPTPAPTRPKWHLDHTPPICVDNDAVVLGSGKTDKIWGCWKKCDYPTVKFIQCNMYTHEYRCLEDCRAWQASTEKGWWVYRNGWQVPYNWETDKDWRSYRRRRR